MYGLLLEAIGDIIKKRYGTESWEEISQLAGVANKSFATHEIYPEDLIPRISHAAAAVLNVQADDVMYEFGMGFVLFVSQYGYDNILRVLGRHLRDFLNGLDNLHDHLRFSYKKMDAPSFFVEKETRNGLTLHYRTRRRGYVHYVRGQLQQVGRLFYDTDVKITVVSKTENPSDGTMHVTFRLYFDNRAFRQYDEHMEDSIVDNIPLRYLRDNGGELSPQLWCPNSPNRLRGKGERAEVLFQLFPFHVVFGPNMIIRSVGSAMNAVLTLTIGQDLTEVFLQTRPIIHFTWDEILAHTNNVFELVTKKELKKPTENNHERTKSASCSGVSSTEVDEGTIRLHLKGQMVYMHEWKSIMFLGTPIMQNLEDMFKAGLYINDLSMHDCSRDLVLAGTQQSAELKLALAQEQQKSQLLTASMKKLDEEIRTTDEFVYQMIPKPVADRLRQGESAVNTCQSFECVTILFSDVVGFTTICSRITPMEVVSMLNAMYTSFDQLSEKHDVYKVETIGDAYMAVAGAPTVTSDHAQSMCDMALDMLIAMPFLKDPSSNDSMRIRIGIHTGSTVAGVVGLKMPRYCLFGDSVNTASRMESNGEAMKIHISETTQQKLINTAYILKDRGTIHIKGKGSMKTYWMVGRQGKSVQEKKANESAKKTLAAKEAEPEAGAAAGEKRLSVTHLPAHRHIYCPVSFDDLAHENGPRPSPGTSPRTSISHGAGEPMYGKPQRKTSFPFSPGRKDSLGRSPERRVSGPCPMSMVSGSPRGSVTHVERRGSLRRASQVSDGGKESRKGSVAGFAERKHSTSETVKAPLSSASTAHSGTQSSVPTNAAHKPTQTVLPTRSDSPSLPAAAPTTAVRPPDAVIPHSGNPQHQPDSGPDQHSTHPPQETLQRPHSDPHPNNNGNNNSDKIIQGVSSSGEGPSTDSPVQDGPNDHAVSSQSGTDSGQKGTKPGRNAKSKGQKKTSERPPSNHGRQKSSNPQKSRSKACVVL